MQKGEILSTICYQLVFSEHIKVKMQLNLPKMDPSLRNFH